MTKLQFALINYFKGFKKGELYLSYSEIEKEIKRLSDDELNDEYKVHVQEMKFYGTI